MTGRVNEMDARTAAGGAAALLLRPDRIRRAHEVQREPVRQLRSAVGAELVDLLDAWAQAGATGELLCAADVLRSRAEEDPALARMTVAVALDKESVEALTELAGSFHRRGQWSAAAWCAQRFAEIRAALGSASTAPATLPAPFPADLGTGARPEALDPARSPGTDPPVDPGWADEEVAQDLLAMVLSACAGAEEPPTSFDDPDVRSPRSA
jgi:hypothetical protein